MACEVANGSIPETVERFLREKCGMHVSVPTGRRGQAALVYAEVAVHFEDDGGRMFERFDWPHDRKPTLQEAIEAVMRGS